MSHMEKLSGISAVLPAFNDEHTIGALVAKLNKLLPKLARSFEIIVVNDASSDKTAHVLKNLTKKTAKLIIITHTQNKGYGATLIDGFKKARKEYIFYTDGDGQYDVGELPKLVNELAQNIDFVSGFKLKRNDPWFRKLLGGLYNQIMQTIFHLPLRDIDCDFRLFRRRILKGVNFTVTSGAFDLEFIAKLADKKIRFAQVGVHHYARPYGSSQMFTPGRIIQSLWDIARFWLLYAKEKKNKTL